MTAFHAQLSNAEKQVLTVQKTVRSLGFSYFTGNMNVVRGLHEGTLGAIPTGAQAALIQPQTNGIKYRSDSGAAAGLATAGFKLAADASIYFDGDLTAFRMIEQTASAVVCVEFFGE